MIETFRALLQLSMKTETYALLAGLLLGISVLLAIRARQVWVYRQRHGYSVYDADRVRHRLLRWALAGVGATVLVAAIYVLDIGSWINPEPTIIAEQNTEPETTGNIPPARILIPRLGVDAPLTEADIVAQQWDVSRLRNEVAHLEGTAFPGEPGNAVLAGHITIPNAGFGPFKELGTLDVGDLVFIEREGVTLTYEVTERMEVQPTDVHVAYPTADTRLTLITCSNWDGEQERYTGRIVVVARPVLPQ